MRWIDNCNVYVCDTCELFFRDDFRGVLFSTEFEPILEEAQKHFDAPMMVKEMECFGFSEENLKEYNVGYLPGGYWAWAFCSQSVKPLSYFAEDRYPDIVKTCKIYNKDYHMARFALPNYLKELL